MSAEAVAEAAPAAEEGAEAAPAAPADEGKPEEAPAAAAEGAPPAAEAPPQESAPAAPEEGAPAAAPPADEESLRVATTQVVKELLGVALKEAEGVQKTVTIEGDVQRRAELKSDEQLRKGKDSGQLASAEEPGAEKPGTVPSEFKKDSLASRERKSKFSMAKVPKSSFRFRTISGSALVIRPGTEKAPKFENSYWLTSKAPFNVDKVNMMLREVVDERISQVTEPKPRYQEISGAIVSDTLSKIRQMAFDRYRYVCVCVAGDKSDQALRSSFRMLWDAEQDNYAWYTVELTRYFVVASVFGIYYD